MDSKTQTLRAGWPRFSCYIRHIHTPTPMSLLNFHCCDLKTQNHSRWQFHHWRELTAGSSNSCSHHIQKQRKCTSMLNEAAILSSSGTESWQSPSSLAGRLGLSFGSLVWADRPRDNHAPPHHGNQGVTTPWSWKAPGFQPIPLTSLPLGSNPPISPKVQFPHPGIPPSCA